MKRTNETNLSDAFEDADGDDGREVSESGEDRREDGEHGRPEDAEQQQALAAEALGEYAAGDLRRHVSVEERRQDDSALRLVPDELALHGASRCERTTVRCSI